MKLGQVVRYKSILMREWDLDGTTVKWVKLDLGEEREGVLVGLRTMKEGRVRTESDFDEWSGRSNSWRVFEQTGTAKAALVATNIYQNPIHVPREELEGQ